MSIFQFGGISGVPTDVSGKIDELYDSCFIYDEVFEHREDDLNFDYNYALDIINLKEACGDEGIMFNLYLTIHRDSLCEKAKDSILNGDDFEINPYDLIIDGTGSILIGSDIYYIETDEEIKETAYNILSFVPAINSMRGFYLDRAWNRIGTTGWDSVKHALGEGNRYGLSS